MEKTETVEQIMSRRNCDRRWAERIKKIVEAGGVEPRRAYGPKPAEDDKAVRAFLDGDIEAEEGAKLIKKSLRTFYRCVERFQRDPPPAS